MNHDDDVICISSDSDDDVSMKDVDTNSLDDSASAKKWNILFGEDASSCSCSSDDDYDCKMDSEDDENSNNNDDDVYCSMDSEDEDDCCCDACFMFKHDIVRDPVPPDDIKDAMKWAETNCTEIADSIYSQLKSKLKNKTVIQIQVYGTGELDFTEKEAGPLQLAIAFNLLNRLKQEYPDISITCQEPRYVEEEKAYLRSKGVKVLETEEFSSEHFIEASEAATNIRNAAFICYMISGMYYMNNEFLKAHWDPDILSRCIFIGNDPQITDYPKVKEFGKICDSKPLFFEEKSLGKICFGETYIYSISKRNAKVLIEQFN